MYLGIVFVQSTSKYGIFIYPTCTDQRLCVFYPPLIYWSLINICWALILVDFIFWAETPNPMPTEERNITKFVLFEFVNMYPQTWIQRDSQAYNLPNIQCLHYFNIIYVSYEKMNFSKTMVFKSRYMYM